MKVLGVVALALVLVACSSGCAMITGTITGPFTGMVDLPRETYLENPTAFQDEPMLYGLDALIVGPCGIPVGCVTGLVKGASLDIQWVCGKMSYGQVFGTCCETSIWRPCTILWPSRPMGGFVPCAAPAGYTYPAGMGVPGIAAALESE